VVLIPADWADPATAPVMQPGQNLATISGTVADQTLQPKRVVWWWGGFTLAVALTGVFVLAVEWLFIAGVGI
jgi:hypothetical protein